MEGVEEGLREVSDISMAGTHDVDEVYQFLHEIYLTAAVEDEQVVQERQHDLN